MEIIPVELQSEDGVTIRGERIGSGERWVVLLHDEGKDLDSWRPLRSALVDDGLQVLLVDLRGHGVSDDPWLEAAAPLDAGAAIDFAREHGAQKVYGVGAGLGATALIVAAGAHALDAIVCLSPRAEIEGFERADLRVTRAPKTIIVGALDERAMADAQAVYRAAIGWKVLESRGIEANGTDQLTAPGQDHVLERTVRFFAEYR